MIPLREMAMFGMAKVYYCFDLDQVFFFEANNSDCILYCGKIANEKFEQKNKNSNKNIYHGVRWGMIKN